MTDLELQRDREWLGIDEDRIDRNIDRAVAAARHANANLWVAGLYAARVVGRYDGGTEAIAIRSGRSVASVQNWAHAVQMYRELKLTGNCQLVRALRHELTITHFWVLWEKTNKYDLSAEAALDYLCMMLTYAEVDISYSADVLAQEIDAHEDTSGNVPGWKYYRAKVRTLVVNLLAVADLPQAVADWLALAPQEVKELK